MTIETAELVSRLNASRDSLKQLNIGEYTLIRSARDVMADAANALDAYDKTMQRIAEAPSPTPPAGDGWKLVPNVPTPEMIEAGADYRPLDAETKARETYRAMLAAAPPPPVSKGEKL